MLDQTIPHVSDLGLFEWLEDLFVEGYPCYIEATQRFGSNVEKVGDVVLRRNFRHDKKPGREDLVRIANRIVTTTQRDADTLNRKTVYAVLAHSEIRGATPFSRLLLEAVPSDIRQASKTRNEKFDKKIVIKRKEKSPSKVKDKVIAHAR